MRKDHHMQKELAAAIQAVSRAEDQAPQLGDQAALARVLLSGILLTLQELNALAYPKSADAVAFQRACK
jgi:hypothetical protein